MYGQVNRARQHLVAQLKAELMARRTSLMLVSEDYVRGSIHAVNELGFEALSPDGQTSSTRRPPYEVDDR